VKNGDILNVDEAAELLTVSKEIVNSRVKENAIPYDKLVRKLLCTGIGLAPVTRGKAMSCFGSNRSTFYGVLT
jgi:hypothetical protein